jgi:ureidoglycolate lyase
MANLISPVPLSKETFAPFGDVIETADAHEISINEGTTTRFHDLANVDISEQDGRPLINIFRGQPRPRPIALRMMERHLIGSQAFIPLQNRPYLVVVAERKDTVAPEDLHVFLAQGHQGVNYHRAVWHHPLLALDADSDFLVVDRGAAGMDLQEHWFAEDQTVFEIA